MAVSHGRSTWSLGARVDPALVTLVGVVLVAALLLAPMLLARRRAPQERGLTPLFQTSCSGSFGRLGGANYPAFRLRVYTDFLVIALFTPHVIPFDRLARVEVRGSSLLGRRLYLEIERGGTYQLSVRNPEDVAR
jgi:hypothetical protein